MIQFSLCVPKEMKFNIIEMRGIEFEIITSSPMRDGKQYFLLEAPEEDMLIFKLKFGSENVWKR